MMNTKLNRTIMGLTFLGVASLGLSGCVVNVGEENPIGKIANLGKKYSIKIVII